LLAAAVTAAAVGGGVLVVGAAEPEDVEVPISAPTTVAPTPLAQYDTSSLTVRRAAFCDAVPDDAVERALGTTPTVETSYDNGQPARITPNVEDIAHEYGCVWSAGPLTARAWVFAPPVTRGSASSFVAAASRDRGCTVQAATPSFGEPSVALLCRTPKGRQASYRGLFGDAWLACSVVGSASPQVLLDRAGSWCVAVAQAASG